MRIALDAMGSDNFPQPDVEGAVAAAREYGEEVLLIGDEKIVSPVLDTLKPGNLPIRIIHAPEMLTMEEKGLALALKAKQKEPKTSMAIGVDLVKEGKADAFVTMGNTGAAAAIAFFRLGMLPGIERPALAPVFPTRKGFCVVLDIGINPDIRPQNLVEFAIMGAIYAELVRGVKRPRVALLSNAEETGKGNFLVREATPLLKAGPLNFIGNVEPKEVFAGAVDVAVTDGFSGNIFLKILGGRLQDDHRHDQREDFLRIAPGKTRRAADQTRAGRHSQDAQPQRGRRGAAARGGWAGVHRPRPVRRACGAERRASGGSGRPLGNAGSDPPRSCPARFRRRATRRGRVT